MKRHVAGIGMVIIFLDLFCAANDILRAAEVKGATGVIKGEEAFLAGQAAGRVFHTFTANDLRE